MDAILMLADASAVGVIAILPLRFSRFFVARHFRHKNRHKRRCLAINP